MFGQIVKFIRRKLCQINIQFSEKCLDKYNHLKQISEKTNLYFF